MHNDARLLLTMDQFGISSSESSHLRCFFFGSRLVLADFCSYRWRISRHNEFPKMGTVFYLVE